MHDRNDPYIKELEESLEASNENLWRLRDKVDSLEDERKELFEELRAMKK